MISALVKSELDLGFNDHFHGTFFTSVETIEPRGRIIERGGGGDQGCDLDGTGGE